MNPQPSSAPPVESMKVTIQPKKNCKKCHGLGRIGFIDGDENNPLICQCVIKIYKEVQAQMKQKAEEAKAKTPLTPVSDGAQPTPITPAEIVQGVVATPLKCTLTEPVAEKKADECVNSANDQPKPLDTI